MKRFDLKKLELGKNVKETAQGFLVIPAFTARTGIQEYRMADGSVLREFRPEEEVFSDVSMASLRTAVVTDGHPKEFVTPENAHELSLGHTDGVIEKVKDGDESFLKTHLVITHKKAIDAIKAGKVELSNGYDVELEMASGEHNGKKYDAIQRNIKNNHIALVWKGRAGKKARLRLDAKDAIILESENEFNIIQGETMKLKIGDKEFEVSDELGKAVNDELEAMKTGRTDSESKVKELELDLDVIKEKNGRLTAKVDSLESDLEKAKAEKADESEIEARIKETIQVRDHAKKLLDSKSLEKLDSMSNDEIKKAVIKADSPNVDEEKLKNSSYVDARFDHIVEKMDSSSEAKTKVGNEIVKKKEDDSKKSTYKTPDEIRAERMKKDQAESYGSRED